MDEPSAPPAPPPPAARPPSPAAHPNPSVNTSNPTPTRSRNTIQAARTLMACQKCREKKVKCSGEQPCEYCIKRRLECVFTGEKRKHIWAFKDDDQTPRPGPSRNRENAREGPQPYPVLPPIRLTSPQDGNRRPSYPLSPSILNHRPSMSAPSSRYVDDRSSTTASNRAGKSKAETQVDSFGSESRSLLLGRTDRRSSSANAIIPLTEVDVRNWPSEDEAHTLLEAVVMNVGISQQLFDIRAFSDNLSQLYQDSTAESHLPRIWIVEVLLVFAIGRMLQGKPDGASELPGTFFFNEAVRQMPSSTDLRALGIPGIEVLGLAALYLQITDRRDEAYIQSSSALRLSIMQGRHRALSTEKLRRSEAVHCNRLWWTIYMQERRLAIAGGYPMAIGDDSVHADTPSDLPGFSSATAIEVNVRIARISARISSIIYLQIEQPETSFNFEFRHTLYALGDVANSMPAEYGLDFRPSGVFIAGRSLIDSSPQTARTASSLYLCICQTVILALRPVLLHLVMHNCERCNESQSEHSRTMKQLAEVCIRATSRCLVILQELRKHDILAKHIFLDLDTIFSIGFIYALVEVIYPDKISGTAGIEGVRVILQYLIALGNQEAKKRLAEIDRMRSQCSSRVGINGTGRRGSEIIKIEPDAQNIARAANETDFGPHIFNNSELSKCFEVGNGLYFVYNNPNFPLTGVDQSDWEVLKSQMQRP